MTAGDDAGRLRLLECLQLIHDVAPDMRLNQLKMFLIAANRDGIVMGEMTSLCCDSYWNVSRGLRQLASEGDPGALAPMHGLVELLSGAEDKRARHIVLTAKGRALAGRLSVLLGEPLPEIPQTAL